MAVQQHQIGALDGLELSAPSGNVVGMRSQILYIPEGVVLDLSDPGFGHPDGREIIERHYRQGSSAHPQFTRSNPAFACLAHLGGTNPGLYLKRIRGEWWAVHYESGTCPSRKIPAPMSDEHKYQTEYWARAAADAGWRVETEHQLHTGTRPDALIHGPVLTGVEVQRSAMTKSAAVTRTRKAALAGVSDVWFTDRKPEPIWAWRVPTVGENRLPWDCLPPRRSATATGLRVLRALRCTPANFDRCPYTGRHCGKHHPRADAGTGRTVDDVAARFPAGEIVALRFWRTSRRDDVLLVPREHLALYQELTGRPAVLAFSPKAEDRPPRWPSGAAECHNIQAPAAGAPHGRCAKCGLKPPGPGGILCPPCKTAIAQFRPACTSPQN